MPRTALRSVNGCLRCRRRKVKCDEVRPACAKCARWDLECVWPMKQATRTAENEKRTKVFLAMAHDKAPPLQYYQNTYLTRGYDNFQNDTHRWLIESAIEFVGKYANIGIGGGQVDLSFCTKLVLASPWTRSAFAAFTANAISRWDTRFKTIAFNSYKAAVVHLRFSLSSGSVRHEDVRFLTSTFFLGLMEYFARGRPGAAFDHLSMVARTAVTHQKELGNSLHNVSSRWIIAMTTLALNLCSNFFWIESRITSIFEGAWDALDAFFLHCAQPLADAYNIGTTETSLRTRIQLRTNRLIYESVSPSRVQDVLHHIDLLEACIQTPNPETEIQQVSASNLKSVWMAEISAMRLYVTALASPTVCSNDPQLRIFASQWRQHYKDFLLSIDPTMPHTRSLLPMTQIGMMSHIGIAMYYVPLFCALHDLQWFEEVAGVYSSLDLVLDRDLSMRIQQMIGRIRHRKMTGHCTLETDGCHHARHDGLDVLRHPQGFLC